MNDVERNEVRWALSHEGEERIGAVDAFQTPEQLHQFALNYNPNDGILPLLAVVRHPSCDAGTATYVYWQFPDLLFNPESREPLQQKAAEWNGSLVVEKIEKRFLDDDFASAEIYFDPQEHWTFNVIQRRALMAAGISPDRLNAVGWQKPQREWLLT